MSDATQEPTQEPTPVETPTSEPSGLNTLLSGDGNSNTVPEPITEPTSEPNVDGTQPKEGDGSTPTTERPEWLPEKFESPESMAESYKELESKFGGFSGAPEEYTLDMPEGVEFEFYEGGDFGIDNFKELAKASNMSQETFKGFTDFYMQSRVHDAQVEQQSRESSVYEVFGGQEAATKAIPQISARVKGTLGEEGMSVYQDAASGSHTAAASAIKLADMLMKKMDGEFTPPASQQPEGISRDSLREMLKDPRYKTSQDFRDQVSAGYRSLG